MEGRKEGVRTWMMGEYGWKMILSAAGDVSYRLDRGARSERAFVRFPFTPLRSLLPPSPFAASPPLPSLPYSPAAAALPLAQTLPPLATRV